MRMQLSERDDSELGLHIYAWLKTSCPNMKPTKAYDNVVRLLDEIPPSVMIRTAARKQRRA